MASAVAPGCVRRLGLRRGRASWTKASWGAREPLIEAEGVWKTHDGERYQLRDFACTVARGERIAVVGPNGAGKSTLLRVLAGEDDGLEAGRVKRQGACRCTALDQRPLEGFRGTVREAALACGDDSLRAVGEYEDAREAAERGEPGSRERLERALERMDTLKAWEAEAEVEAIMDRLGCGGLGSRQVNSLSGGQRKRVALAGTLMRARRSDVLLLDEPSDHLSVEAVEWLEGHLRRDDDLALLLVSHDRALLEAVCGRVLEVDGVGNVRSYHGGYRSFLRQRERLLAEQRNTLDRAQQMLKKESEWVSRQPKARGTKQKSRLERYEELQEVVQDASLDPPTAALGVESLPSHRLGSEVVDVEDASLSFGDSTILHQFSFSLRHGDCIGVVGKNGAGKSTFLRVLTGDVKLDEGSVQIGDTVVFGHLEQEPSIPHQQSAWELANGEVERHGGEPDGDETARLLRHFGFERSRWSTRVGQLSGGEKQRLAMLRLYLRKPNVILADEPTTSLDFMAIEALESLLQRFDGVLVVASHDREFLDNVASQLLVFEGEGRVWSYMGKFTEFRQEQKALGSGQAGKMAATGSPEHGKPGGKHREKVEGPEDPKERKRRINAPRTIKRVERQIVEVEQEVARVKHELERAGADYERAQELAAELSSLEERENELLAEYEELEQLVAELDKEKAAGSRQG